MNAKALIPMQSYDLARYAVQVPCYVCEGANSFDAELCRHCFAPMALAHQANSQNVMPKMIATVGSTAAGKTVYLGTLVDMLSRQSGDVQLLARGAFSISLQQATIESLLRCIFPSKTPTEPDRWNWVHCQLKSPAHRRPVELIMPDMAGEAILEEIEHPQTFPGIRSLFLKCSGVMMLIDVTHVEGGRQDQDFFTMKILSYLTQLADERQDNEPTPPLAMVFTKADLCDTCFDDPQAYAQQQTPGLVTLCHERFPRHRFFAAGVAGACASRRMLGGERLTVPLRVEPRGIAEPFLWLVDQLQEHPKRRSKRRK